MRVANCKKYDSEKKYQAVRSDPCRVLQCREVSSGIKYCENKICDHFKKGE